MTDSQLYTLELLQIMAFAIIYFEFDKMVEPWNKGLKGKCLTVGRFFFFMMPSIMMTILTLKPL